MSKSYVVKQQKPKTSFWHEALFFGKSLISNDTCVEARTKPWWSAVLIALISTIVALLPISISAFSQSGSTFLSSPTYSYESQLVDFDTSLKAKGLHLKVANSQMTLTSDGGLTGTEAWAAAYPTYTFNPYVRSHQETLSYYKADTTSSSAASSTTTYTLVTETKTIVDFAAYWVNDSTTIAAFAADSTTGVLAAPQPLGATGSTYSINCLFLSKDGFWAYKLPSGTSSYTSLIKGKWDDAGLQGMDLATMVSASSDRSTYESNVLSAYKDMMSKAYNSTKITNAWMNTGIFSAVFVGLALVLGLMVFLMTRGKNNPFRIYTFWESQKIAYWASFSPAVLSLLAFIPALSNYAILMYIFFYGMRVMWMSMRSLRPQYEESK